MDRRRKCLNNVDIFCYICGEYSLKENRKPISEFVKRAYLAYFGIKLGDQDKSWAPHIVCKTCIEYLRQWSNGKRKCLKFGIPMIWREPQNHHDDCYFCKVNITGINRNNRNKWNYPNLSSALRPVPHSDEIPIPKFKTLPELLDDEPAATHEANSNNRDSDSDFAEILSTPQTFNQEELSDLIRDLGLSKEGSELLASRLKDKHLLSTGTKITFYRKREENLLTYFSQEENLVFCHDINGLLTEMGICKYQSSEWRLFIDSSKRSLKCVILHNGNKHAAIPIAHSTKLKEEYDTIVLVMNRIKYHEHEWVICVDLKMVNFLLGQQSGYTKHPCFLCLWDSRAKEEHWKKRSWPVREQMVVGIKNVIHKQLVAKEKIILPPLHIKLGLMKQFVKALDKNEHCFCFIIKKFPGVSMEKLKAGIFDGPQIRQLIKDPQFKNSMNDVERKAWTSFEEVIKNFLGNHKGSNYKHLVERMLESFRDLGCNMSVKLHYLHSHLDWFPENLGNVSEEQGERFHQDLRLLEDRYQGRWDTHMMADYCWSLTRHCAKEIHSRKSKKKIF